MIPRLLILVALVSGLSTLHAGKTDYVFLVTGDGIRHQEVFGGADAGLMNETNKTASGIESLGELRAEFWADDARVRRERLMPFLWKELARHGILMGNREIGSRVSLTNPHRFSYPGYAEILNGQYLPEITSNDPKWSPREPLPQFLQRKFGPAQGQAAVFGSWHIFNWISMQRDGAVFCNAGYERMPPAMLTPRMQVFDQMQFDMLSPWDSVRHDAPTLELALEFIQTHQPRFVYLALGESDDWAHARRYDRTLQSIRYFDEALARLWRLLQQSPRYQGKSTLIVTTDHGRGRTAEDWTSHGAKVEGAQETWIGIFGPDTPPKGEVRHEREYALSNIATTVLKFYGLDAREFNPEAAPPIEEAFGR